MKDRLDQNFDSFAENYRDVHTQNIKYISGTNSFYFAEYKVMELLKFEENKEIKVLDLGCGDGTTEVYFEKYFPLFKITGIDISSKSIEEAQKKQLANSDFQTYDSDYIPFENETFDIIFIAGVLHHIDISKHQQILNELNRVLKENGRLYLFEHNPLNPLTRYLVKTCEFDKGVKLLYSKTCENLLIKSGFRIKNLVYTIFFPRKIIFKYFIKFEKYLKWLPLGGQYYFRVKKN